MVSHRNDKLMRYLPFAIGLPSDFTCWHFGRAAKVPDILHTCLVIARAEGDEGWVTAEWEKGFMGRWGRTLRKAINRRLLR